MFKVKNRSTRHCSGAFGVNFENIQHVVLVFSAEFGHVNARWDKFIYAFQNQI